MDGHRGGGMSTTTVNHAAIGRYLDDARKDLDSGPYSICAALALACDLLHECSMVTADPSPLATQANIVALVDCARLAADRLGYILGHAFEMGERQA